MAEHAHPEKLRRTLGLGACTLMAVGVILGAGIYALVGKAAGLAGNAVWLSFVIAAVVAALTGLGYAELASFIPRAGGEYHYAQRAFGRGVAFVVSWLLLAGLSVAAAAVALGFGGYLGAMTGIPGTAGAAAAIAVCAVMLTIGIRESVTIAGVCTALEVAGLIAIIAFGMPYLGEVSLTDMPHGVSGIGAAAVLIFFAYIGFEEIVQLAEETRDPTRTLPRALVLSLVITTVLYVLVAIAAISILGSNELGASESPLADVAERAVGFKTGTSIALIALFSTFNTVLVLLMSAARLLWGVAEDGALPKLLARVHGSRRTPWIATLVVSLVAAGVALLLERIETVAEFTNFALFTTFLFINAAVIVLRIREPDIERPFRVPGSIKRIPLIPVLGIISVVAMMTQTRPATAVIGAGLVAVGALISWLSRRSATRAGSKQTS